MREREREAGGKSFQNANSRIYPSYNSRVRHEGTFEPAKVHIFPLLPPAGEFRSVCYGNVSRELGFCGSAS